MNHIPMRVIASPAVRPAKPTRRALAKQRTREKVLAAARQLFTERGYEGATIRDIAKAAAKASNPNGSSAPSSIRRPYHSQIRQVAASSSPAKTSGDVQLHLITPPSNSVFSGSPPAFQRPSCEAPTTISRQPSPPEHRSPAPASPGPTDPRAPAAKRPAAAEELD